MIERLSHVMGAALVGNNFSPVKISSHMKKKQSIKNFLTIKLSQYSKSGSMFSSREPVVASSDCCRLRKNLCLCLPILPALVVLERGPKSLAIDFAVKTFY